MSTTTNTLRPRQNGRHFPHYIDVIMTTMASQITSLTVVYSTVYSDADHRKHQSSASLAFVWGIHRDRWIPRTKGQLRGKCFHLMTSSWDIFKCVFFNENVWITIKISLTFVPQGPVNNISALIQIMAWRRPGDGPLSVRMMVSLLTHICVTRPQWVLLKPHQSWGSNEWLDINFIRM